MEMLRAGANRLLQIFRLRCGHDENNFFRRLFKGFKQSVGRFGREHMGFVQNHHLVPAPCGRVANHLTQFAHLVDAAV